jgi:ribonucleoside-diphosphate reductase alpha chain
MSPLDLSEHAYRVLEARYFRRDSRGRGLETPEALFERVARGVAHAELLLGNSRQAAYWEEEFYRLLSSLEFLPNSPALMNAGTPLGQLSACFVLPVADSIEGIFTSLKHMALLQRTGGGTGFSFSQLRPAGDTVASTGGTASGPVSFLQIFNCATEHIKQGGRRRGACMGTLRMDHPDIMAFVGAKREPDALANFNLSVGVTDQFMHAVQHGGGFQLIHPRTHRAVKTLRARELFDAIVAAAWSTGDPGLLFLDAIERGNPTPRLGQLEATNPCGEIPLLGYEACVLGSINLARMLRPVPDGVVIDWEKLTGTTEHAVRFLDDVIEVSRYPIAAIERMSRGNRKIGLGVMGFAEMLVRLAISYDSDDAVATAERVMSHINEAACRASAELARTRGVFPNWPGSRAQASGQRVRNATRTAIAPTGTIGIIAGASASIEPLFGLAYRRAHVLGNQVLEEVNPCLRQQLRQCGLDEERILSEVMIRGSLHEVPGVPDELRRLFVTALDIPPERHLQIQAAFQQHVDNAVSKTVNLPQDAGPSDIAGIFQQGWQLGLKGLTVYRYGSKPAQVLELGTREEALQYAHGAKCDPAECRL